MEWRNALILLRLPFSIFLLPVFLFALVFSSSYTYDSLSAFGIFIILHVFMYPASNGYNSYFDKDTESIGGLESPPLPNKKLLYLVNALDVLAIVFASFLSLATMLWALGYIAASRAYSGKPRLKKYPILSTLLVTGFQGAGVYFLTLSGLGINIPFTYEAILPAFGSTFFLMGAYPLTQIYQHKPDAERGDLTLSRMLGIKGTFLFSAIAFAIGGAVINYSLYTQLGITETIIFGLATAIPVVYFTRWGWKCSINFEEANFKNAMTMNVISSVSLSIAYLIMIVIRFY